jgi:exonuclease III
MKNTTQSTRVKAPSTFFPQVASSPSQGPGETPRAGVNDAVFLNLPRRNTVDKLHAKEDARRDVLLSPKRRVTVGCWNVRTLVEPAALGLLIHELERFRWDVIGLAETHWKGVDDRQHKGYRIISTGRDDYHMSGVALIISTEAQKSMLSYDFNGDRIVMARFQTTAGAVSIVQVYAPTASSTDQEIDAFYDSLQNTVKRIPPGDGIIVMGDFNAKVGVAGCEEELVGKFGVGQRNSRGEMLMDFCALNNLCITNTLFKQAKVSRIWTWESPNGRDKNQIDYILVSKRYRGSVKNSRSYPSADVGSDHQLVLATIQLKLRRKVTVKSSSTRVDIAKLAHDGPRLAYQRTVETRWEALEQGRKDVEEQWSDIKLILQSTAADALGYKKGSPNQAWITDTTLRLADERRKYKGLRNTSAEAAKHHNYLCREVRKSARKDREQYILDTCEKIEKSSMQNKSRDVYESIRKLTGSYAPRPCAVKDRSGKLITGDQEISARWREYFNELYNDPNPVDVNAVQAGLGNLDAEPDITQNEVESSLKRLKKDKSPGVDNITAEELKAAMEGKGLEVLHAFLQCVWTEESVPAEWKRAIIIPLHKKKDKMDCNNYRGISLLCHSSKIYTSIVLHRLRKRTDEILSEEQAGFRAGRSTIDQIYTLRQLAEKCTEFNKDMYICYIDFKKAFDSIWRAGLWRVMRSMNYPEKIVRILENMYEGTFSAVRIKGELTDWFETVVGVLQGCVLSPLLFNVFLEAIMARALISNEEGITIGGTLINNLRFADDIAALSESENGLQNTVESIDEESKKMGMKVNVEKTEVQFIGKRERTINIEIQKKALTQSKEFVYLGGTISNDDMPGNDIKRRIGIAYGAMQKLTRIWKSKNITLKTKVKVYEALVLSVIQYNSETWTMKKENVERLKVFEMACLRRIAGISRRDRIRNTDIRQRLGITVDLAQKVQKRRLKYFGHVERMGAERYPHIVLHGRISGVRSRGRPRKRWLDNVEQDCNQRGKTLIEATRVARDRAEWRVFVSRQPSRALASPRL